MTEHPLHIEISQARQRLWLKQGDSILLEFPVSTSKNGVGECMGSECTPCGEHEIEEKIGAGCPVNTVFVGRQPTGEIYSPELREQFPGRDWILTRILWLNGLEPGRNQGGEVDSKTRYIYLHGTPDDVAMGIPGSRGCVRMRNQDIQQLFERVETRTKVRIFPE